MTARLDDYDVFNATGALVAFVDSLSNWWVRRSRARFWQPQWTADKQSAYETLYACLTDLCKLLAPFMPYAAESMYQNLVRGAGATGAEESVHLDSWPQADLPAIDPPLAHKTAVVRALVSLGLRARMDAKIRVRQPLRAVTLVLNDQRDSALVGDALDELREELNVLSVRNRWRFRPACIWHDVVQAELPIPRCSWTREAGSGAEEEWARDGAAPEHEIARRALLEGRAMRGDVELLRDDVEMTFEPAPGFAAAGDRIGSVFLETKLDDELLDLGLLREILNRVQAMRKDWGLDYTDRLRLMVVGSPRVVRVVQEHRATVAAEVLAADVTAENAASGECGASDAARPDEVGSDALVRHADVEGESVKLRISRAEAASDVGR